MGPTQNRLQQKRASASRVLVPGSGRISITRLAILIPVLCRLISAAQLFFNAQTFSNMLLLYAYLVQSFTKKRFGCGSYSAKPGADCVP